MESNLQTIPLPDGRRLAYAEFGDPRGEPLFYCHGFPGSRLEAFLMHQAARDRGLRLLSPDRPGYGQSDKHPKRRLTDWPADLQALAAALDLDRFHLLGVSGGAPFALACAADLGDRLRGLALACPLGPLSEPGLLGHMHWPAWTAFITARVVPWLPEGLYRGLAGPMLHHHPEQILNLLGALSPRPDSEVLSRPEVRSALGRSMSESVRLGLDGALQDQEIYLRPWGFDLDAIDLPVTLWHGRDDATVPLDHSRYLASALPNADTCFLHGEGHYSLPIRCAGQILERLVDASRST